jgi:hypothetical protein
MKSNKVETPSDHLELMRAIYIDACAKCTADVSDLRDLKTLESRVKNEGISFLTITLPLFCLDFETSLQSGVIDSTLFQSFRKSGSIPAFLQGMTSQIFDRETGRIYDEQPGLENSDCVVDRSTVIDSIRQLCLAFKKIELPCTLTRVARALNNFTAIEQSLKLFSLPKDAVEEFSSTASVLWGNTMGALRLDGVIPRHGPGTTADRMTGNQKYAWSRWHDRLEPFFPLIDFAYTISSVNSPEFEKVTIIKPEHEQPVKVVTVPKTLKSPRIIAIEPCCMQYAQQAIRRIICDAIENSEIAGGHVNFTDQSVNQNLAMISSKTGLFATIDLSDASDRVPRDLALEMFRSNPDLRDAIDACRSTRAMLPDGSIIDPLSKFASMGSALCFPVESMYFYTICVAALLRFHNLPVSHANVFNVSRGVYVYGDDIIVPQTAAVIVLDYLQKYNCKVNTSKTFVTGRFRESCGVDAYNGEPVTPVYIRKDRPENKRQASKLISWVATANQFYRKGYWHAAQLMFCTCERILGSLPYVSETSPGLGRVSFLGYRSVERWNRDTQQFEVNCWVPRVVYRSDSIDGYAALMKCLLRLDTQLRVCPTEVDPYHLVRTALRDAVALTRRGVPSLS